MRAGNSTDLKSDTSSPWWIGMVGTGGAHLPYRNNKMNEELQRTTLVGWSVDDKSTPLAHNVKGREEEIGLKGQYNATTISHGCTRSTSCQQRLDKCMRYVAGQRRNLASYTQCKHRGRSSAPEAFNRLEPPQCNRWGGMEGFKGMQYICGRGNSKREKGRTRPTTGSKGEPPKLTRHADKSGQSLTMPHQEDKMSSWRDNRWKAVERLKNPLVDNRRWHHNHCPNRMSQKDRVALQCYHNEELWMKVRKQLCQIRA